MDNYCGNITTSVANSNGSIKTFIEGSSGSNTSVSGNSSSITSLMGNSSNITTSVTGNSSDITTSVAANSFINNTFRDVVNSAKISDNDIAIGDISSQDSLLRGMCNDINDNGNDWESERGNASDRISNFGNRGESLCGKDNVYDRIRNSGNEGSSVCVDGNMIQPNEMDNISSQVESLHEGNVSDTRNKLDNGENVDTNSSQNDMVNEGNILSYEAKNENYILECQASNTETSNNERTALNAHPEIVNEDFEMDMEWLSEDFHMYMLGKICRVCGDLSVMFDGPKKGVHKLEVARYVNKIWKVDISEEDQNVYPVNVCLNCERKIKRLYLKVSKKKKCVLFRKHITTFEPHSDQDCPICLLKNVANTKKISQNEEQQVKSNSCDDSKQKTLEPRRNPARKRGWGEPKPSFKSVECQTEWEISVDSSTALEESYYTQDELQYLSQHRKKVAGRPAYNKQPLTSVNAKYLKQERLRPVISQFDQFCQSNKENKVDVLFFMLTQALRSAGDKGREMSVLNIWNKKSSVAISLTEEECLAKRVMLKQTKEQYRKEYSYYKEKLDKPVLKPPFIIDKLEKTYFPQYLDYHITDNETNSVIWRNEKSIQPSYFAIPENIDDGSKVDGVLGVRWHYFDVVAKTLDELLKQWSEDYINDLDEGSCIHVDLSDHCEEKKDTSYSTDKNDGCSDTKRPQYKVITYLFCVQSLQAVSNNCVKWMLKLEDCPPRPLMKALVNDGGALQSSILSIEKERNNFSGNVIHLTSATGKTVHFSVFFSNAAPEVRKDYRNMTGLSLSSFRKIPSVINRYGNLCLELKRGWLASSPKICEVAKITNCRTKCSRCGKQGHNIRKCTRPSDENGETAVTNPHKRMKKQRSIPADAYPTPTSALAQQHQLIQDKPVTSGPTSGNSVMHTNELPIWNSSVIDSGHAQGVHQSQNTQVLIPSSDQGYQTVPHGSLLQNSEGTSPPVYVWTYTVVQPPQGTAVVHQQSSNNQIQELSVLQQQQQQIEVVHKQHQQQQIEVVHKHQLPVIHSQAPQHSLAVELQHESGEVNSQALQQLMHQSSNKLQPIDNSQHLVMTYDHATTQSQPRVSSESQSHTTQPQTHGTCQPQPLRHSHPQLHERHPQGPSQPHSHRHSHPQPHESSHSQPHRHSHPHESSHSQPHESSHSQPHRHSHPHESSHPHSHQLSHSDTHQSQEHPQHLHPNPSSPHEQLTHSQSNDLEPIIGQW